MWVFGRLRVCLIFVYGFFIYEYEGWGYVNFIIEKENLGDEMGLVGRFLFFVFIIYSSFLKYIY